MSPASNAKDHFPHRKPEAYRRWTCPPEDLRDLTPEKVKQLILTCFFEAQQETFLQAKRRIGSQGDKASLKSSLEAAVRLAFQEAGGDYNHPDKATLQRVVEILGRKATAWGTPKDIIAHHANQIRQALNRL